MKPETILKKMTIIRIWLILEEIVYKIAKKMNLLNVKVIKVIKNIEIV